MKWLFKWALRLVILLVTLVILFFVFKDSVLRRIVEHQIRDQTGMEARIGKFTSGTFSPVVTIENLKLYNTAEFGGTLFLDVPELHLELDPLAFAQGKVRVSLLRLNLAELDVVKNELGQTNITTFIGKAPKKEKQLHLRIRGRDFEFDSIEVLNLSLGKARFLDLASPQKNHDVVVNMQNQIFKNVKEEGDLYGILIMIWLRSGGAFSISPTSTAREFIHKKAESAVRQAVDKITAPTQKK
jgi:uncharacterized protein involved in outer membrane biogenesis